MAAQRSTLTRPALICAVALTGLLFGFFLGPLNSPNPVQAMESASRTRALLSAGEVSVVVNAILYDVVAYVVDLPVIMNNAP